MTFALALMLAISACAAVPLSGNGCAVNLDVGISVTFVSTDAAGVITSFAGNVGATRAGDIRIRAGETDLNVTEVNVRLRDNPPLNTPLSYDPTASYQDVDALPMQFSSIAPDGFALQGGTVVVTALSDSAISLNMTFTRFVADGVAETLFIDAPNVPFQACSAS